MKIINFLKLAAEDHTLIVSLCHMVFNEKLYLLLSNNELCITDIKFSENFHFKNDFQIPRACFMVYTEHLSFALSHFLYEKVGLGCHYLVIIL